MTEIKNIKSRLGAILTGMRTVSKGFELSIVKEVLPDGFEERYTNAVESLNELAEGINTDELDDNKLLRLNTDANLVLTCVAELSSNLPKFQDLNDRRSQLHQKIRNQLTKINDQITTISRDTKKETDSDEARQLITLCNMLSDVNTPALNLLRHIIIEDFFFELHNAIIEGRVAIDPGKIVRYGSAASLGNIKYVFDEFRLPHDADMGIIGYAPARELAKFAEEYIKKYNGLIAHCGLGIPQGTYHNFMNHNFCTNFQIQHHSCLLAIDYSNMLYFTDRAKERIENHKSNLILDDINALKNLLLEDISIFPEIRRRYKKQAKDTGKEDLFSLYRDKIYSTVEYVPSIALCVDCAMNIPPPLFELQSDGNAIPRVDVLSEFISKFFTLKRRSDGDAKSAATLFDMQSRYGQLVHQSGIHQRELYTSLLATIILSVPKEPLFHLNQNVEEYFSGSCSFTELPKNRERVIRDLNTKYRGTFRKSEGGFGEFRGSDLSKALENFDWLYRNIFDKEEIWGVSVIPPKKYLLPEVRKEYLEMCHKMHGGQPLDRNIVTKVCLPAIALIRKFMSPEDVKKGDDYLIDVICERLKLGIIHAQEIAEALSTNNYKQKESINLPAK